MVSFRLIKQGWYFSELTKNVYVSGTLNIIRELLGFPYGGGCRILRKNCPPNQRNKVITIEYFPTIVCVVTFETSESEADNYVRTSYHCSETELHQEASLANFALPAAGLSRKLCDGSNICNGLTRGKTTGNCLALIIIVFGFWTNC